MMEIECVPTPIHPNGVVKTDKENKLDGKSIAHKK